MPESSFECDRETQAIIYLHKTQRGVHYGLHFYHHGKSMDLFFPGTKWSKCEKCFMYFWNVLFSIIMQTNQATTSRWKHNIPVPLQIRLLYLKGSYTAILYSEDQFKTSVSSFRTPDWWRHGAKSWSHGPSGALPPIGKEALAYWLASRIIPYSKRCCNLVIVYSVLVL